MSKNRSEVQERTCRLCGHTYNSIEYNTCPVCEEMKELSKDFLITTDDDIDLSDHYNN